jgi:hypothetical protein
MKEVTETFTKAEYPERWYDSSHYFGISQHILGRDNKFSTGKWYQIKTIYGTIYRVLRYQPQLSAGKGEKTPAISLDYDGGRILGFRGKEKDELIISIRELYIHEYLNAGLKHPDPSYRLASWLGLIALIISIIDFFK